MPRKTRSKPAEKNDGPATLIEPTPPPKPKRPLNSYQQFFKELYPTPECQAKSVRERVSWIAGQWRKKQGK